MNWKPPTTETEWEECLSAYADGELDSDSTAALEAHLQHDAVRTDQLEAVRKTSAILHAWSVDAPPPSAALLASMKQLSTDSLRQDWPRRSFAARHAGWLRIAAAFAIGALAGGWAMSPKRTTTTPPSTARVVNPSPPAASPPTVSQARAAVVFKEVEAAALTQRIQQAARDGEWKYAVEGLERMQNEFAETNAAHAFAKDPMARRIYQRSFRGRS